MNPNSIAEPEGFTNRYLALIQANVDGDGVPDWRYYFRKGLAMSEISIRPAERGDVPRLTEIYNYYVLNTAVTFDIEPYTVEKRYTWFEQFGSSGRYRLLVADENRVVLGYVGTTRFAVKAAYDTSVETTIYCDQKAIGKRIGTRLYQALFDALKNEDVNRLMAGYTLPNDASAALHARCGFRPVGIYTEVGRKFGRYWDVAWTERPLKLS